MYLYMYMCKRCAIQYAREMEDVLCVCPTEYQSDINSNILRDQWLNASPYQITL